MTTINVIDQLLRKNNEDPSNHASVITYLILKGLFHKRVIIPPELKEVTNV